MTNFLINRFFKGIDLTVPEFIIWTIRAAPTWFVVHKFSRLNEQFADWFFRCEKRQNSIKDGVKFFVGYSPQNLIPAIGNMAFIQKMKLSSKSLGDPVKKWRLGIIALNLSSKCEEFTSFLTCSVNIKTTFGIDKTRKICKIFFRGGNGVAQRVQLFFYRKRDKVFVVFFVFHLLYKMFFSILSYAFPKFSKNRGLSFFLNKELVHVWEMFKPFFRKSKVVRRSSVFCSRLYDSYGAVKSFSKPHNWPFSNRYDYKVASPSLISYLKTAVPIYISSCISIVSVVHYCYNGSLAHLSQQVIDKTNNAFKFTSGIEGDLKFGKTCAELKLWVIDLELAA